MDLIALITVLAAGTGQGDNQGVLGGLGIILLTLGVVVAIIAVVWTVVAKRGSRTPRRKTPEHRDHVTG